MRTRVSRTRVHLRTRGTNSGSVSTSI